MLCSDLWIFLSDNINKFLKIDLTIPILIGIINHLFNLSHGESFANTLAYLSKLLDTKKSRLIFIKDLKQLFKGFLAIVIGIKAENIKECCEVKFLLIRIRMDDF